MQLDRLKIPDLLLVKPTIHSDHRGFFAETFRRDVFTSYGIDVLFVQDNHVLSTQRGVLRGLHFQLPPHSQGKLVRCIRGAILDVAVDIRAGSPTFGQHATVVLTAASSLQLWVPEGFAHGYVTLEENCEVEYKVTDYYSPDCDRGIAWNDPSLAIDWQLPVSDIVMSDKDKKQPLLADLPPVFKYSSGSK